MSDTKEKETPIIEEEKLNDQMKVRREKMQEFIDAGVYPFGQKYNWDHHAQEVKDDAAELEKMKPSSVSPAASWLSAATARRLSASFAI